MGEYDNYEFELDWCDNTKELIRLVKADSQTTVYKHNGGEFTMYVPSKLFLYNLKLTHRYLKNTPHFLKTMEHIKYMRNDLGVCAELSPEWKEFFSERERLTLDYGKPNLKRSKEEFFTPDVPYLYDHDYLHSIVSNCMLMETPAYQKFAIDGQEVLSSRTKFCLLPENVRLDAVVQEACVLALERSLIPFQKLGSYEYTFPVNTKDIFLLALEKVCTSITSGWFREYAWENYNQAVETFDRYYYDFANTIHKEIILFPSEIIYHKKAT